jgi:hypothetical protein
MRSVSWLDEVKYNGLITIPTVISHICGINIEEKLSLSDLQVFNGFKFDLSDVIITLAHLLTNTSLTLKVDFSVLIIKSLHLVF